MSWLTPELIDVIIAVLKAIVILLVVVVCGALLSFVERRLLGWWARHSLADMCADTWRWQRANPDGYA